MKKRFWALFLAVMMVVSMLPTTAFAEEGQPSPVVYGHYDNGVWVQDSSNGTRTENGITLSKIAVPGVEENTYDITLQVQTSTTSSTVAASAATVLVIDLSSSMKYCSECGKIFTGNTMQHEKGCTNIANTNRLTVAKAAALSFLATYGDVASNSGRYLAIVTFSSGATTALNWIDVSGGNGTSGYEAAESAINGLQIENGTNLDAGLYAADGQFDSNIISSVVKENRFAVVLSDGAPTLSRNVSNKEFSARVVNAAAASASGLRAESSVYTVCFGAANEECYTNGPTVGNFLKTSIATSTSQAYNADNTEQLNAAFTDITKDIVEGLTLAGATVTDPMASRITVKGSLPAGVSGNEDGFTWTLSNPEISSSGTTTIYTYTLTYTVELDTTGAFDENAYHPTNQETYLQIDANTTLQFPIPAVKGVAPEPEYYTLTYNNTASVKPATATIPQAVTGIEYNGSVAPLTPATTTENSKDGVPGTWTFDGWYLSEDLSGSAVTSVSDITADVNVYAKWSFVATTYTVTYDLNGGTSTTAQLVYPNLAYGVATPTIANPTKDADAENTYTFNGWLPAVNPTVTANATYVAQWSTIPREAKLTVTDKSLNTEGEIKAGDAITWTITVQNNGNKDAQLTSDMIADTIYFGDTAEGPWTALTGAGSTVTFPETMSIVKAGESASFDVTWFVTEAVAGKYIKNAAKINLETETEKETPPVYVTPAPSVSVSKTADKPSAYVGDKITYTVTVCNDGNVDLKNVTLADSFGSSIANVKVPTGVTYSNGVFTIAALAKNESVTVTYDYIALNAGKLSNTVVAAVTVDNEEKVTDFDSVDVEIVVYDPVVPNVPDRPQLNKEDHYAYIVGYPDGLVHPEKQITRAEVATIFFRMLLDESREDFWAQENWYSDVVLTDWFNNAVSTLSNAGLINGYPDGSYRPNANITRAEFATIAIRFFLDEDVEITENNLTDVKGHWAEANINLAYALKLINGYPDGSFRPDQQITRAEAMTIVNRVLNRAPDKDHLLEDMIVWPDNMDEDMWYYATVQEATNSHEYYRVKDGEHEVWTELLPVRDWVALEQMWSNAYSSYNPGEVVDFKGNTP